LKAEDPSQRRSFESALSPLTGSLGDPLRRLPGSDPSSYAQASGYQRSFRPLQAFDPSRPPMRGPPFQSMYAQPSISPSPATAAGTFVPSLQYQGGQTQSSYSPPQSESAYRSIAPYSGGYNYPPPPGSMGPPAQMPYSNPIFPRSSPRSGERLPPMQDPSSLQLPPIRPAPPGPIDPAITQPSPQQPQPAQTAAPEKDDGTQEPDPKRPKMDIQGILGPRNE
jgi:hypothetical protein